MTGHGPQARLAAVAQSLDSPLAARAGVDALWMRMAADRMAAVGLPEASLAAAGRARALLIVGGGLGCREDGARLRFAEREAELCANQDAIVAELARTQARLARRAQTYERVAELAIRAAADSRLMSAPNGQPRSDWLDVMAQRMAGHADSIPHVARLGLALSKEELLSTLDATFRKIFGV